jgi:hypothetical protein
MWAKFQALEPRVKWGIVIAVAVLFVLAAVYGSPSPSAVV